MSRTPLVSSAACTGAAAPPREGACDGRTDQACERREDEVVRNVRTDEPSADLHAGADARVADQADGAEGHERCANGKRDPERSSVPRRAHRTTSRVTHFVCMTPGRLGPMSRSG